MDNSVTVPIGWLFAVAGILLTAFFWWLRTEWNRNWREHEAMRSSATLAHVELDKRIDAHHIKIDEHILRIHKRIDWIIQNHQGIPAFPGDDE